METKITRMVYMPFSVTSTHIERLFNLLKQRTDSVTLSAKCKDNALRKFDTVQQLLDFENTDMRKILDLMIEVAPENRTGR